MAKTADQADMWPAATAAAGEAPRAAAVGRPKGARNKRTAHWQDFVDKGGAVHPMSFLLSVISATPAQLRERYPGLPAPTSDGGVELVGHLGGKDILALQTRAAEAALPYLEQKLPLAVEEVGEAKRTVFVVGALTPDQVRRVDGRLGLRLVQQNQQVSEPIAEKSDEEKSDAQGKLLIEHDIPETQR